VEKNFFLPNGHRNFQLKKKMRRPLNWNIPFYASSSKLGTTPSTLWYLFWWNFQLKKKASNVCSLQVSNTFNSLLVCVAAQEMACWIPEYLEKNTDVSVYSYKDGTWDILRGCGNLRAG
ncbi:hypothetical protein L9F63_001125, partial [Diploptera punctata]